MKLLLMRFRETQSQRFAKHGLSWHFSAVIHQSGHPDCQAEGNNEYTIHTYVAAPDNCKQDWFSVSCIVEEVLVTVKETHPSVSSAVLRSDNAGCSRGGGHSLIWPIRGRAAGQGMVFRLLCPEQAIQFYANLS